MLIRFRWSEDTECPRCGEILDFLGFCNNCGWPMIQKVKDIFKQL